jgi:ribosomal protein S12 methylthiotransferase accessory factor
LITSWGSGAKLSAPPPHPGSAPLRPPERDRPLAEAADRVLIAIARAELTAEIERLGDAPYSAWRCLLSTRDGSPALDGEGLGKGVHPQEGWVGALCEALEHYASGRGFSDRDAFHLRRQADILAGPLRDEGFTRVLNEPAQSLACLTFEPLAGGASLAVPAGIVCPWYVEDEAEPIRRALGDLTHYRDLWRYSSNSGNALGIGRQEAVLHALHELIERDGYSLFLLDGCVRGSDMGAIRLHADRFDRALQRTITSAQGRIGAPIELFDITTEIGVPATFAMARREGAPAPYRGSGASLSRHHATARAVSELVQDFEYDCWSRERSTACRPARPRFDAVIERCQHLEFTAQDPPALHPNTPETVQRLTVGEQLAETVARLRRANFVPYARTVARFAEDVSVVQVFVPGLERFMLVTAGHPLAPGTRGREVRLLDRLAPSRQARA